jgi:hypothetical protein
MVFCARSSSELYSSSLIENSFSAAFATDSRSDGATPSISEMVIIGSRPEHAATKSTSPAPTRSSTTATAFF